MGPDYVAEMNIAADSGMYYVQITDRETGDPVMSCPPQQNRMAARAAAVTVLANLAAAAATAR